MSSITNELSQIVLKYGKYKESITSVEATKITLVLPFLQALKYDVFNPTEVVPDYTAGDEHVDFAVFVKRAPLFLVQVIKHGTVLPLAPAKHLVAVFKESPAKLAIVTNGIDYQFYGDFRIPNQLDEAPFLELSLRDLNNLTWERVANLGKYQLNLDEFLVVANQTKIVNFLTQWLKDNTEQPSTEFLAFLKEMCERQGFKGEHIDNDKVVKKALLQYVFELTSGFGQNIVDIDTINLEAQVFKQIQTWAKDIVSVQRIVMRSNQTYNSILFDDNNRKPICRLHFKGRGHKYLGLIGADKKETRVQIATINDLEPFKDKILTNIKTFVSTPDDAHLANNA